jgi:hypothetical protein
MPIFVFWLQFAIIDFVLVSIYIETFDEGLAPSTKKYFQLRYSGQSHALQIFSTHPMPP